MSVRAYEKAIVTINPNCARTGDDVELDGRDPVEAVGRGEDPLSVEDAPAAKVRDPHHHVPQGDRPRVLRDVHDLSSDDLVLVGEDEGPGRSQ